jgi:hypothetical protein
MLTNRLICHGIELLQRTGMFLGCWSHFYCLHPLSVFWTSSETWICFPRPPFSPFMLYILRRLSHVPKCKSRKLTSVYRINLTVGPARPSNLMLKWCQKTYASVWKRATDSVKGPWQWLIHYRNIMLDIVHCLRYIWCTRLVSWLYSSL